MTTRHRKRTSRRAEERTQPDAPAAAQAATAPAPERRPRLLNLLQATAVLDEPVSPAPPRRRGR
jgi:hypothetical protein